MSDYLTRLLERSRGLAPQIEPLIAPWHTPSNEMFGETTQQPAREFGLGPAIDARSTADAAAPSGVPRTAAVAPEKSSAVSPEIRITERKPSGVSPTTREFPGGEPAESGSLKEQRSPAQAPSEADAPSMMSPGKPPPARQRPVIETFASDVGSEIPADQSTSPLPGPGRIVVLPQVAIPRSSPDSIPAFAPSSSPNEPPAIHVTIGRVEVRAIMPPAPPRSPAPSPAAPKISLEEYLKQRNGTRS